MSKSSLSDVLQQLAAAVEPVGKTAAEVPSSHPTGQLPDDPPAKMGPSAEAQSAFLTENAISNQLVDSQGAETGKEETSQSTLSPATLSGTPAGNAADPAVSPTFTDPGTAHPASAGGEKYANFSTAELTERITALGNMSLAAIASRKQASAPAAPAAPAASVAPAATTDAGIYAKLAAVQSELTVQSPEYAAAITQGYKFAESLGISEREAQRHAAKIIEHTVKQASEQADAVAAFLAQYHSEKVAAVQAAQAAASRKQAARAATPVRSSILAGLAKRASDDMDSDDSQSPPEGSSGSGGPPAAPPEGGEPPMDPAAGGGELPMDPAAGGGDPLAELTPQQIEELIQILAALQETGAGPEELIGSGAPIPEMPGMTAGDKLASQLRQLERSGNFTYTPAKLGTPERALREQAKKAMAEMLTSR